MEWLSFVVLKKGEDVAEGRMTIFFFLLFFFNGQVTGHVFAPGGELRT